jgi:hypothetical protein
MRTWCSGALWAAPLAWTLLAVVTVRSGHSELLPTLPVVALILVGVGGFRALAGSRGGLAGRAAELVLAGTAVAWLVTEPASHRILIALTGAVISSGLALIGVWPGASREIRCHLAGAVGTAAGLVVAAGTTGAPSWGVKALFIVVAATATGWLLARILPPALAAAATVAIAAVIGPASTAAWLLPPLVAAALLALQLHQGWLVAGLAVIAAGLPPAGLAVSAGLLVAAARRLRSPLPLGLLAPAVAIAWWRLADGVSLVTRPQMEGVLAALPLTMTSLPLLVPAAVLGLLSRNTAAADGRDALGAGLLVLPLVSHGDWTAAAIASLWLTALPAAASASRLQPAIANTLPWTVAAGSTLLLLAPWGGAGLIPVDPLWLAAGWTVALLLSLARHQLMRLVWALPAAGLLWTVPVEGIDRHLGQGETIALSAPSEYGWVIQLECNEQAAPGQPVLTDESGEVELVAGRDCSVGSSAADQPLLYPTGVGRGHPIHRRGVSRLRPDGPVVLRATGPVVVRVEDAETWQQRKHRMRWLLVGALLLLVLAHLWQRTADLAIPSTLLLAGAVMAGSSVALLARLALLNTPDLAAAVLLGCWLAVLPRFRGRRFLAGAVLLVPLALAQPLLRPPAGDEGYHLILLESLRSDQDLALTNNIDPQDPAEAIYLRHQDRLIHSPLLALLVLPGYLLLGHAGALAVTALMVAGGAALVAGRCRRLGHGRRATNAAWLAALLSYPALTFATQLWPGSVAILLVAGLLLAAARASIIGSVLAAAVAIVVKVRLAVMALPLALVAVSRRFRLGAPALVAASVIAATVVAGLLGSPLGRHRLGELRPAGLVQPLLNLWGLLWDSAGGIAFAAPLWLVGLILVPAVWRRGEAGERGLVAGALLTFLALAPRGEWYGGGSPPARYLVPLLPLFQLALAEAVCHHYWRRWLRLALPWAVVVAWIAATRPLWLFNQVDGSWWLSDRMAQVMGIAAGRCFPNLLRSEPATWVVPLLLAITAVWWAARVRRGAVAVTIAALTATVIVATTWPQGTVHAEDLHVQHLAGTSEPPPGSFFRARRGISWRLPPGGEIAIPWRPPAGKRLMVRVRRDGPKGGYGTLLASWDGGAETTTRIFMRSWHSKELPPPTVGADLLHLRWQVPPRQPTADLLVDMVMVDR